MVGWHHQLNGHEFEQTLGDSEGQGSLACCSPWGRKESDTTERLNNNKSCQRRCLESLQMRAAWSHGDKFSVSAGPSHQLHTHLWMKTLLMQPSKWLPPRRRDCWKSERPRSLWLFFRGWSSMRSRSLKKQTSKQKQTGVRTASETVFDSDPKSFTWKNSLNYFQRAFAVLFHIFLFAHGVFIKVLYRHSSFYCTSFLKYASQILWFLKNWKVDLPQASLLALFYQ